MTAYAKKTNAKVVELMDFALKQPGKFGVTRKWCNRIAEELRNTYRAKYGRKGYTVRVERARRVTGTSYRIVVVAPQAATFWETRE